MPPAVATIICAAGVVGLFVLERENSRRVSLALWIPLIWVSLAASRMASQWLGLAAPVESVTQAMEGNGLDRSIQAALMAAGVMVLLARGRTVTALLRANAPILVFFGYCALSVLWSDYPDVAVKRWTKAAGDVVMILIILTDRDRPTAVKQFLARLGFLLVPASILLIKYYPTLGRNYSPWEGRVRHTGVAMDKNMLGVICLVAGLACAWRVIEALRDREGARKVGPLIAQSVLLAMVLWLFRLANSMTSLACFVSGTTLMVATTMPALARRRSAVHLLVLVALTVATAVLFFDVGSALLDVLGRDATLTGRTGLWKDLLGMSPDPLVGAGFENFWVGRRLEKLWAIYWWRPNEAHNGYLEVYLNLGWIGVGLLAAVILTGYRNVLAAYGHDPETSGLRLAYFVAGVTYGLTEAAFRVLSPVWTLFLMAAMAIPVAVPRRSRVSRGQDVVTDAAAVRSSIRVVHRQPRAVAGSRLEGERRPPGKPRRSRSSGGRSGPLDRSGGTRRLPRHWPAPTEGGE